MKPIILLPAAALALLAGCASAPVAERPEAEHREARALPFCEAISGRNILAIERSLKNAFTELGDLPVDTRFERLSALLRAQPCVRDVAPGERLDTIPPTRDLELTLAGTAASKATLRLTFCPRGIQLQGVYGDENSRGSWGAGRPVQCS